MFGATFAGAPYAQYGAYPRLAPTPLVYALLVDWNGAGDFGNAYSNVSSYLLDVQFARGRHVYNPLMGRAEAGTLTAVLDNRTGIFSSLNAASPLFGKLLPLRKVQFRTIFGTRWTGYVKSYIPDRQEGVPVLRIEAEGPFVQFAAKKLNAPADAGSLTGTIIGAILDAAGWSVSDRSIEAGQSTTSRWYEADVDAMTALRRVEETELGFLYEDRDGLVVFEDRAHRRTGARLVSQVTYSDAPGAAYPYVEITQFDPLPYIVNDVLAAVTPYTVQALQDLWTLADTPTLAAGETKIWYANYPSPTAPSILTVAGVNLQGAYVDAWTTPAATTDYTVTGVALGDLAVTVAKYAQTMRISIKNNHATNLATITLLKARGTPVTKGTATSVVGADTTSQTTYGLRTYRLPAPWLQNTSAAQDYVNAIIASHKNPLPLLELKFRANLNGSVLQEIMGRRISDRVTVIASQTRNPLGINGEFFVEYLKDHYDVQQNRYEVTMGLSQVMVYGPETPGVTYWVLNTSVLNTDTYLGF